MLYGLERLLARAKCKVLTVPRGPGPGLLLLEELYTAVSKPAGLGAGQTCLMVRGAAVEVIAVTVVCPVRSAAAEWAARQQPHPKKPAQSEESVQRGAAASH